MVDQELTRLKDNQGLDFPELDIVEVWANLYDRKAEVALTDRISWGKATARYFRHLSRQYVRLYPGVEQVLKTLKTGGCQLFLLSNAQVAFTEEELAMTGVRAFFDEVYLSSDYGMCKPQSDFLMRVLDDQALDEDVTLVVGDNLETDMVLAESLGIDGVLVNSQNYSQEMLRQLQKPGYLVISQITDLLAIISD